MAVLTHAAWNQTEVGTGFGGGVKGECEEGCGEGGGG